MFETGRVIGVPVTVGNSEKISQLVVDAASENRGGYVCAANVHMVATARQDAELRTVMEHAKAVTSDGMPVAWALKQQGFKDAERVTGIDLTVLLCELASIKGMSVYFLGSTKETIQSLQKVIAKRFPDLQVAGYMSPPALPQKPSMDPEMVKIIRDSGAKVVFVGLGCPKQEFWMAAHAAHLSAVLIGVGAAFDFLAGTAHRAPLWMQSRGLEWLFRLGNEPGRLWKRYLMTNTQFLWYLARDWIVAPQSSLKKRYKGLS